MKLKKPQKCNWLSFCDDIATYEVIAVPNLLKKGARWFVCDKCHDSLEKNSLHVQKFIKLGRVL
jgi:hypothetical protein